MAKKREPVWATRLRDLLRDFVAAKKRSRLRFVLVQTIGAEVKDLQPSVDENCSRTRTAVTLGDGAPAMRWTYRFGRKDNPVIPLIERGDDILKRHGDDILKLFGLKFVNMKENNWLWLLARLRNVEHPFRGDIQVDVTLAGHIGPKQMRELVDFTPGSGPPPKWLEERHKSFRRDIPHVAVASIAAIRAILDRVESAKSANGGGNGHTDDNRPKWDRQTKARNKWLYEQCMKVTPYSTILIQLKKKPAAWQAITETNGIKRAASAYAERMNLSPIPKRAAGRAKRK